MTNQNQSSSNNNRFRTGNFHSVPPSNVNLGTANRTFFEAQGMNPDQNQNIQSRLSGGDNSMNDVFQGSDSMIANGKSDLKSIWKDMREVKNIHIFNQCYFNQELAVVYNTNQVKFLTTDQVNRYKYTKVKGFTNRTRFREFMLETAERREQVPRYWKSERGKAGKSLQCPLYNEEFWTGIIFTVFREEYEQIYFKAIYRRNLKLGEFSLDMGFNNHIFTKTSYDNVQLNGENQKLSTNLRKKATNRYLIENCADFKSKVESGMVNNQLEQLNKFIISDPTQIDNQAEMDREQLLHVINQHNSTFSTVANNWGTLNKELTLFQQLTQTINPNLQQILAILNYFGIDDLSSIDTRLLMDERAAQNIKSELTDIKENLERGGFVGFDLNFIKGKIKEKILQVLAR